jgi:hypothetical protein
MHVKSETVKEGMEAALLSLALLASLAMGCERREALPQIEVLGDAAHVVHIDAWRTVRSLGIVVQWQARMTRRHADPLGSMRYVLYDAAGAELARGDITYKSSHDFRGTFAPGDSVRIAIPAHRGGDGVRPSPVRRLMLTISAPPAEPTASPVSPPSPAR